MRGRRAALAAFAVLVATGSVLLPTPPSADALVVEEVYVRPANGVFVMDGHGWGHGRGLNQWGAQGAALNGVKHLQILAAYYPGTTHQTIADKPIRVYIEDDDELDLQVRSATGLTFTDLASGVTYPTSTSYARWRTYPLSDGFVVQKLSNGSWVTHTAGGKTRFAGPVRFQSPQQGFVRIHYSQGALAGAARDVRGSVSAIRTTGNSMVTVNSLSLEHYLYGVVPRESPAFFHGEALRAQAVAARSYSAYKRGHVSSTAKWDICSTIQCQVYGGKTFISASGAVTNQEHASTTSAVDATRNQVRWYDGGPIFAEFSSSNGGWSTRHSTFPYLAAQRDDWDALESPSHDWVGQVSVAQIEARYPSLGRLARLRVVERDGNGDWGGRVKRVILEGTRSDGTKTSVEATGGGIYLANPWQGGSHNGPRGSWWKIRTDLSSSIERLTPTVTLVKPPGLPRSLHVADVRNTGTASWPTQGLHLALASPAAGPDPLVHDTRTPGYFAHNLSRPGATSVDPGELARFRIPFDLADLPVGTYTPSYRVRIGTGPLFGSVLRYTIHLVDPVFTAEFVAASAPPGTTVPPDQPSPVAGTSVTVPRNGSQAVRLAFRNTGNVAWPVDGPVMLAATGPRYRESASSGADWLSPARTSPLVDSQTTPGATSVPPGAVGVFDLTLFGNGKPAGATVEAFEAIWSGEAWLGGVARLAAVRTDPDVPRLAERRLPTAPVVGIYNHPLGAASLRVQLRNLGSEPWTVGTTERMTTAPAARNSRFQAASWASPQLGGALVANASRPGAATVYPGETGEYVLPFAALRVPAGDYVESFQAVRADGLRFGPVITTTVRVTDAVFSGALVAKPATWTMARDGSRTVSIDVRNTGNVSWPLGSDVRASTFADSPSRTAGWLNRKRAAAITANVTAPGTRVSPGQVARFTFTMAANNRAPGSYSEDFGVLWEGYAWTTLRFPVTYKIA